jgi:hypothetical protein
VAEETLSFNFEEKGVERANLAADALERLDEALDALQGKSFDVPTEEMARAAAQVEKLRATAGQAGSALATAMIGAQDHAVAASAAAIRLSSVLDLVRNRADQARRAEQAAFAEAEKGANRLPAHLQVGPKPIDPDWFSKGLAQVSNKAGSALQASADDALTLAANIAKSEMAAKKLSSVYELVAKRAAAAAKAEKDAFDEKVKAANKLPDHLKVGPEKGQVSAFAALVGVVGKLFGAGAAGGLVRGAGVLSQAADRLGPLGPMLLKGGSFLAMGAAAAAAAAAALVIAAGVLAVKLLQAGMQLAIAATSARESFEAGVKRFVGGAAEAREIYASAIKVAIDLSLDKDEVLRKAKELAGVGFKGAEIGVILRARADIAVSSEEKANAFQKLLEKLKSGKSFQEVFGGIAEAGINSDAVLGELATKLGVKIDKVKELLKAGKIDVQTGMAAIIAAAQKQYGGAAGNAADTVPAKILSLRTLLESMFDRVDLSGIKAALDSIIRIFEGADGERFKAAVNKLFGTISDIVGEAFSGQEGEARLIRFITGATKAMEGAAIIMEKAGPQIITIIDAVSKVLDRSGSTTGGSWTKSLADGFLTLGSYITYIIPLTAGMRLLAGAIEAVGNALGFDVSGKFAAIKAFALELPGLGLDMMNGLVAGIIAGTAGVVNAMVNAVKGAIAAARNAMASRSPSKRFEELGITAPQGLAVGIARGNTLVANAGQNMAAVALGGAQDVANDNGGSVRATGGAGGGNVTIIVQVQAGPGTTREQAQAAGEAAGEGAYRAWRRHMGRYIRDEERAA